jgi:hypothetical protein
VSRSRLLSFILRLGALFPQGILEKSGALKPIDIRPLQGYNTRTVECRSGGIWQTRCPQEAVGSRPCRFESGLRHQYMTDHT